MKSTTIRSTIATDTAAEFAAALSLWRACESLAETNLINLSECYHGIDQLMREVMRIAHLFERWASAHVEFAELSKVWPYLLEDQFGNAFAGKYETCFSPNCGAREERFRCTSTGGEPGRTGMETP